MALKEERSWEQLIKGWLGTQAIWTLSNFGVLLLGLLLAGTINYLNWAFFWYGEYGCASTCWIVILKEKWGYMGKEELAEAQGIREEVDQVVADSVKETKGSKQLKEQIEEQATETKEPIPEAPEVVPEVIPEPIKEVTPSVEPTTATTIVEEVKTDGV